LGKAQKAIITAAGGRGPLSSAGIVGRLGDLGGEVLVVVVAVVAAAARGVPVRRRSFLVPKDNDPTDHPYYYYYYYHYYLPGIDAKYDVAISTACGYLDHIVVESTNGGAACVDFLRQNSLGR